MSRYQGDALRAVTRRAAPARQEPVARGAGTASSGRPLDNPFNGQTPDRPVLPASQGVAAPPQIPAFQRFTPSVAGKRRGVDNNVTGGASIRRQRLDLAGTPNAQLARMRGTLLGTGNTPPVFADAAPNMAQFQAGPEGAPLMSGFGPMFDPYARGVTPTSRSDAQNISWGGMPAERPSIWDAAAAGGAGNRRIAGTTSGAQFIDLGGAAPASTGVPNPFESHPWQAAANRASKSNKTGAPNARVKYTVRLAADAARFAHVQQAYFPLVACRQLQLAPKPSQRAFGALAGPTPETLVFNLTVANYLIAASQTRPRTASEVKEPVDVLDEYTIVGAAASEEGQRKTVRSERAESVVQRNVVMTMGGDAFNVYNYWGNVPASAEVGFILKGVPIEQIWAYNARDAGSYNLAPDNEQSVTLLDAGVVARVLLQFVPWYDRTGSDTRPSIAELSYKDDFGRLRQGVYIPFGTWTQLHGELANQETIDRAWCSAAAAMRAGQCGLIVSRKGPVY